MRVGSLFSGIGGIELGFEREGFETVWLIEKDLYAQTVLKKRFPHAKIYDDITTVDFRQLPKVDILTGGFPCQDISQSGRGVGITGSRSGLWKYYCKAIRILRPHIALIENVPVLTSRGLNTVLCDLAKIGYDAEWHCISASSIGANHRRDRIFILAYDNRRRTQRIQKECRTTEPNEPGSLAREIPPTWTHELPEPPLLGKGDGLPCRVDRTHAIGNAVCPRVAQTIAQAIKETEES